MKPPYYQSIQRMLDIMHTLRKECPWDRKQTLESLKPQTVEELYELTDAIDKKDWKHIREESGDMLMHLVFYSLIAEEQGEFTWGEIIEGVCNKLVHRHPHIYAHIKADTEEQVKQNWEKIKLGEGKQSVLEGVPDSMPAMNKAIILQRKTAQAGMEGEHTQSSIKDQINEEWNLLEKTIDTQNQEDTEAAYGDLLFLILRYARHLQIDPERALERANTKFRYRFNSIEEKARENGQSVTQLTPEAMKAYWQDTKAKE